MLAESMPDWVKEKYLKGIFHNYLKVIFKNNHRAKLILISGYKAKPCWAAANGITVDGIPNHELNKKL